MQLLRAVVFAENMDVPLAWVLNPVYPRFVYLVCAFWFQGYKASFLWPFGFRPGFTCILLPGGCTCLFPNSISSIGVTNIYVHI